LKKPPGIVVVISFIFYFFCFVSNASGSEVLGHAHGDSLMVLAQKNRSVNYVIASKYALAAREHAIENNNLSQIIEISCLKSIMDAAITKNQEAFVELYALLPKSLAIKDSSGIGRISAALANCYYYAGNFDSSIYLNQRAIDYLVGQQNDWYYSFTCLYLAKSYLKTGNTKSARIYYEKLSKAAVPNTEMVAWAMDLSGEIYHAQRLFKRAIEKYHSADLIFTQLNNVQGMASSLLHTGNAYYMLMKDDSAKKYYDQSLIRYLYLGDSSGIANCYSNLSRLMLEAGNYKQSIVYARNAVSISRRGGYHQITANTLQQLGDIYLEQKQYLNAIEYIQQALLLAQHNNHRITEMDCYKSLSEIYRAMNNHSFSYKYLLMAYHLKDSLQPLAFSKQLAEVQGRYLAEKEQGRIRILEKNNVIQKLEIAQQNNQLINRNIGIASGLMAFLLIGGLVYTTTQKQKLKAILEKKLAIKTAEQNERLRFAKDIHDDLGSGLSKINFLSDQLVSAAKSEAKQQHYAASISETARSLVGNMHDLIWALNPENTTLDNLIASIREYSSDYLEDFPIEVQLFFPEQVPSIIIIKESHREIFMTIKEILNNVVKHSEATMVNMTVRINNGMLLIEVMDNGKGFKVESCKSGNGLRNMNNRIESIGGTWIIKNPPTGGTSINMLIPVVKIATV
jgi:signal transduction histidine kinase